MPLWWNGLRPTWHKQKLSKLLCSRRLQRAEHVSQEQLGPGDCRSEEFSLYSSRCILPPWWNGIHAGLKILWGKPLVGSSPTGGTIWTEK